MRNSLKTLNFEDKSTDTNNHEKLQSMQIVNG